MTVAITVPIQGYAHDAAYFQSAELTDADLFVIIYTDGTHAYRSTIVNEIRAAGKGVLFNHENAPLQLGGGAGPGTAAASAACAALIAYGCPQDGTKAVIYSVDGNPPATTYPVYAAAYAAIRAVHRGRWLVGFYGALALFKYLNARGLLDVKCWLSGSSSFAGYNPNDPDVGLIQTVGTDIPGTDRDVVTAAEHLGVWWPDPPDPKTRQLKGDEDVPVFFSPNLSTIDIPQGWSTDSTGAYTWYPTFTTEGGIHWIPTGAELSGLSAAVDLASSSDGVTSSVHVTADGFEKWDWISIKQRYLEKYGPGGLVPIASGTDFGAGPGTVLVPALNGAPGVSLVPLPGNPTAPVSAKQTFNVSSGSLVLSFDTATEGAL